MRQCRQLRHDINKIVQYSVSRNSLIKQVVYPITAVGYRFERDSAEWTSFTDLIKFNV